MPGNNNRRGWLELAARQQDGTKDVVDAKEW